MEHPFSEEYIPMAVAAAEIQAEQSNHLRDGEWRGCSVHGPFVIPDWPDGEEDRHDTDPWLPLLHQLLAMLPPFFPPARMANPFLSPEGSGQMGSILAPTQYRNRFEQVAALAKKYGLEDIDDEHELALCVVMRERFGKVWRDGAWIAA